MNDISSGDKLMKLRKIYGVKQYELAGDNISRSYIGMVEQNRRKITRIKAEEIVKNFNNVLLEKQKNVEINLEDFFVEAEDELTSKAEEMIKLIKNKKINVDFIRELKELEKEIILNTFQNKASIYLEIAKKMYSENMYDTAVFYYDKSLEYFLEKKKSKDIGIIVLELTNSLLNCNKYQEVEFLYYRTAPFMDKIKNEIKNQLLINFAKSFTILGEFRKSISILDEINIETYGDKNIYMNIAENYENLIRYKEAEFYYEKALENSKNSEYIKTALKVLLVKIKQNSLKREIRKNYVNLYKKIKKSLDEDIEVESLIDIAKVANYLEEHTEAIELLKRALKISEKLEITMKIIELKINTYLKFETCEINELEEKYFEALEGKNSYSLVANFSRYYLENDMHEKNIDFINRIYSIQEVEN